ncbi:hypothetical protein [Azospirillum agricola]|uniref:hypothetical protein n=1 Tax=Azospirillum agricola TaxID=1720247 RepID=UPI000A0F078E|nr:hypothetical protein [Azospirillum agricola]SMH52252.1 hypothetical protein SAMN02982994_3078 [Azospirillum lipoferum]
MSNSYVDGKVREAIMAARGSRTNAQKLLMAWAAEDPDLLRGIAQPFLKAIAAAAIERAARPAASGGGASRARGGAAAGGARPSASGLSRDALESLLDRLGREDDGGAPQAPAARQAGAQPGGAARASGGQGSGQGSGQGGVTHEKAMMAIAKAFVAKKVR